MKKDLKKFPACDERCPVRASLTLLSGKWTLMILFQINENVVRYGELKRAVTGISEKMLIQELNMLVENKLVNRKSLSRNSSESGIHFDSTWIKNIAYCRSTCNFWIRKPCLNKLPTTNSGNCCTTSPKS